MIVVGTVFLSGILFRFDRVPDLGLILFSSASAGLGAASRCLTRNFPLFSHFFSSVALWASFMTANSRLLNTLVWLLCIFAPVKFSE